MDWDSSRHFFRILEFLEVEGNAGNYQRTAFKKRRFKNKEFHSGFALKLISEFVDTECLHEFKTHRENLSRAIKPKVNISDSQGA